MPSHSLPETVFAEVLEEHSFDAMSSQQDCECGWDWVPPAVERDHALPENTIRADHRAHVAERLAECLVFVGVEHTKGGRLYRVGRCPDDSPVYAIRDKETP